MRPRISIRGCVCLLVRPLVRWSVRNAFVSAGRDEHFVQNKSNVATDATSKLPPDIEKKLFS